MKSRLGCRNAFTLIETMIAMSLMSLLMAIVWTMFSIYTKIEAKGVARAEEAGLVRAISRQIRHDLLQVVGVDQDRGVSIDDKSDPTANRFPANGYLVGTSTDMHFLVCLEPGSAEAIDVIRMISYQPHTVVAQKTDQLDQTESVIEVTEQLASAFTDEYETPLGIDRHQRSWIDYWEDRTLDDSPADLLSTDRPLALDADDLIQVGKQTLQENAQDQRWIEEENVIDEIPELARLSLRYFDGDSWSGQWDSTANGRLPLAIEVGFDLAVVKKEETDTDPESRVSGEGTLDSQAAVDTGTITVGDQDESENATLNEYRFIVSIPAASIPRDSTEPENDHEIEQEPPVSDGAAITSPLPLGGQAVIDPLIFDDLHTSPSLREGRRQGTSLRGGLHRHGTLIVHFGPPRVSSLRLTSRPSRREGKTKPHDFLARGGDLFSAAAMEFLP